MPDSTTMVTQARTWLGTPFHHQARLKGKGCDCLGLIVGVVDELGLKNEQGEFLAGFDEVTYSKEPDGAYLVQKLTALLEETAALGLTADDALAMGDGANDLDMIKAAGLGIAYHAKPIVAAQTLARIAHTDLRAALLFQGYAVSEIVAG